MYVVRPNLRLFLPVPTYLTLWPQLFRWYPEIEEIEFLLGTHETKI